MVPLIAAGLCLATRAALGQTFSEWWLQKKTRIKYLHKQIQALDESRNLLRSGDEEAERGVDTIEAISNDELSLHQQHLQSLYLVKLPVKDSPGIVASRALVVALGERANEKLEAYVNIIPLTREDKVWLGSSLLDMVRKARYDLEKLEALATDGLFEMKDDERRDAIQEVERAIRERYENGMLFLEQMGELLRLARQQKANDDFIRSYF
jgi:hypothetical protein